MSPNTLGQEWMLPRDIAEQPKAAGTLPASAHQDQLRGLKKKHLPIGL